MPPVKKTAAKKAAKKAADKHAHHPDPAKDTRRAYEHLGRVQILHPSLPPAHAAQIATLTTLAQGELAVGHANHAADLLRAAEHLGFGALSSPQPDTSINPSLAKAIAAEFDGKLRKAEEHWSSQTRHHPTIHAIYTEAAARARNAFGAGAYRQALELARAAEALAHLRLHPSPQLPAKPSSPKLPA